jgi:hypothetical protein
MATATADDDNDCGGGGDDDVWLDMPNIIAKLTSQYNSVASTILMKSFIFLQHWGIV